MGADQAIFADIGVMPDLDMVIEFCAFIDDRIA